MVSEKAVVGRVMKFLRSLPESRARKVVGTSKGRAGEPDIDAVVQGRAVKLEVKTPQRRNEVTAIQRRQLDLWGRAGAVVGVVTHEDEARALLAEAGFDFESERWVD